MKNNIKLGVGLLTVLATPFVIGEVSSNEVQAAQGWVRSGSTWYHYKTNGSLTRNAWVGNYWLGADGKMATNSWVDNNKYYVGANGAWVKDTKKPEEKKSGWVSNGNTWYYYNAQGQMVRNAWAGNYWLGVDGRMVTNSWVDNNNYYVGHDGLWVKNAQKPGWTQKSGAWYYYNTQGQMVRNAWAGNYWLGADGKMVVSSWVDNGRYYVDSTGKWIPNYGKENNVQPLNMPQYYQGDSRWGSKRYGVSTMRNAGCVPTSLAMAFSGLGKQVQMWQM